MQRLFRREAQCDHAVRVETVNYGLHRLVCGDCGLVWLDTSTEIEAVTTAPRRQEANDAEEEAAPELLTV